MTQNGQPSGSSGEELKLKRPESFYEIFIQCVEIISRDSGFNLTCNPKLFKSIVTGVEFELRRHYPNIKGHSAVKWAAHLCSAIHHVRPVHFSLEQYPEPTQTPEREFQLNSEIGITFAIQLMEREYRMLLLEKQRIKQDEIVFAQRSEFLELLNQTFFKVPYTINNQGNKINPMVLTLMFESFLEGRYPNVIKEGSNW
ncbi:MAG: hypothetical protein QM537_05315 [Candidatus Symbiobacter sp.]|nr:hypothetical protein [Candidatus Symbiobacter sp.]